MRAARFDDRIAAPRPVAPRSEISTRLLDVGEI
jgi:hypothetical protein